jgi:hypothetical protein
MDASNLRVRRVVYWFASGDRFLESETVSPRAGVSLGDADSTTRSRKEF